MSVKKFSAEEISVLKENASIKNVSENVVTYEKSFKEYFIQEYNKGKKPTEIFRECNLDPAILGERRIHSFTDRVRKEAQRADGFNDTRHEKSGRPRTRELTEKDKIAQLEERLEILQQENDFLKRMRFINGLYQSKDSEKKKRG